MGPDSRLKTLTVEVASTVGPVAAAVRLSRLLGMFSNEDQFKDMERRRHKPKAVKEIKDLAMHPSCRTPEDMVGLKRSHWILFVVDIKRMKVNLLDPLRDESNCNLRAVYSTEFYVMEKIIPCMLHFLDDQQYKEDNFMQVRCVI
ncbi:hypothetical protein POM88_012239 [Heracleum sosnowskyi]|uniref:Uncharacterized protein n=1 Tax=Heracleum sosnowskyi TaxID=360622 RepID=A0AAD8N365_9APIA|nr:hypothetical protein POM88_012239 [Heracleum sosnowskyi]